MKDMREVREDSEVPTISSDRQDEQNVDVLPNNMLETFRKRWSDVQAGFVDDPKSAVENADQLVEETVRRLTETFARERENLEQMWSRGEQVSTEDLRLALQRYRSFFNRLLFNVAIVRRRGGAEREAEPSST